MRHRSLAFLAAALCWLAAACKSAPPPAGWKNHNDPRGFSVSAPPGWTVASDAKSGRVTLGGPARERVVAWPVFLPKGFAPAAGPDMIRKLAAAAGFQGYGWDQPRRAGPAAVRMEGRQAGAVAVAAFAWAASPKGAAGCLYLAAAPEAAYRAEEAVFAAILASFKATGASGNHPAAPEPAFTRWHDPLERAFSLDVPQGWQVQGGTYRFASVDTRAAVEAVSPDSRVRIALGDKNVPTFTEPNQMLSWAGFREGSWYSPGYGLSMLVKRYMTGEMFAREYVTAMLASKCPDLTFRDVRSRPEADEKLNALYAQAFGYGVSVTMRSGEAAFECEQEGRAVAGYWFAGVLRTQAGPQGAIWNVPHLYGFAGPPARASHAQQVLGRMLASFRVNPEWARMQGRITADTSRIVTETSAELSRISSETYWNRQRVLDGLSRPRSNAMLGLEDVVDPVTGREYKVESGANYYWVDHKGRIAGTETYTQPNIDFRELTKLP